MQDRARRAQAARLNANLALFGADQAEAEAKQVEDWVRGSSRIGAGRSRFIRVFPLPSTLITIATKPPHIRPIGTDDPDRPGAILWRCNRR